MDILVLVTDENGNAEVGVLKCWMAVGLGTATIRSALFTYDGKLVL